MASSTRENTKKNSKNKKKKILLVAQELKLARILAGNNKTARDRALKSLKKWFQNRATAMRKFCVISLDLQKFKHQYNFIAYSF